jgi:3-deoxy-D-manno-octulosonic-acid transferase
MLTVYRLLTSLYFLALRLAALVGGKAKLWVSGRRDWKRRLDQLQMTGKVVWVHCASLGEYEQARPLIEALVQTDPSVRIVLTFFSPTGYTHCLKDHLVSAVLYLPPDSPNNARDFVGTLRPDLVLFIKYEFWYFTLSAVKEAHVPLVLVSAHFRPSQFSGLRKLFFQHVIPLFDHIFVQDDASRVLLEERLGYENATLAGDTRYDRVWALAQQHQSLPVGLDALRSVAPLIVCGSTWPADERFLAKVRQHFKHVSSAKQATWIIVPHEPGPAAERRLEHIFGSDLRILDPLSASERPEPGCVYVLNRIGWLSRLYALAAAGWVGGGFGTGIHNVLEAAVYGKGVCFGPNYRKFFEAVELVDANLAWSFNEPEAAAHQLSRLVTDTDVQQQIAQQAVHFVKSRCGATHEILRWLEMQSIIETDSTI